MIRNKDFQKGLQMIIYIHPKCSTCQKALLFLKQKEIQPQVRDITQQPPSLEELKKMIVYQHGQIKKLLNTSGQLYREMGLSKTTLSTEELLLLLSREGMLVKRPFLLGENFGCTGFKEAEWKAHFLVKEIDSL